MALVTLTVVRDEVEAEMLRGLLRTNGIESSNRTTDLSWGSWSGEAVRAWLTYRLRVDEEDIVAARALLPEG